MASSNSIKLSVCMIVKNEAHTIGKCLSHVIDCADELILVDTGSTDNTIAVAKEFGAILHKIEWKDDFSLARNISLSHAHGDWILWLDADDVIPVSSVQIINTLKKEKPDKVYAMTIKNERADGTGTIFLQARMFPNHQGIFFERPIHEQIMPQASKRGLSMIACDAVIEHHGYASPSQLKKKAQRNIEILKNFINNQEAEPVSFVEIADSYQISEDLENALQWYMKVVDFPNIDQLFPHIASQAYYGIATIYNRTNKFQEAQGHFQKAHDLCPQRTDVLYGLAICYEMMSNKQMAIKTFYTVFQNKQAPLIVGVNYRESEIKSYIRCLRLLSETEQWEDLEALCLQALKNLENRPEINNAVGLAYFKLNKLIDALHRFEHSVAIVKQNNLDAYIGLCMIYNFVGRIDVLTSTVNMLYPHFQNSPRFWALCHIANILPLNISVSTSDVSVDDLNKEISMLVSCYKIKK